MTVVAMTVGQGGRWSHWGYGVYEIDAAGRVRMVEAVGRRGHARRWGYRSEAAARRAACARAAEISAQVIGESAYSQRGSIRAAVAVAHALAAVAAA